ncbi:hypothetical protein TWF103_003353 [Orbilia oligospora]|nr:hypothetical protein TWF103_003353 [Orbilia oligospora]
MTVSVEQQFVEISMDPLTNYNIKNGNISLTTICTDIDRSTNPLQQSKIAVL